ncbi:MAG: glutathione S-transferase family protein [Hyphomicrobium sp.]|nr:glutathione S-transferase family protein [Hyphomicrobium sp.]
MSAEPLIHYHAPNTRSSAVRWLFEELGNPPHEMKPMNLAKGDHKTPWYMAINPMGMVPTVVHGGTVITEAAAIAMYLADIYPEAGLAPKIGDTARGTYLRWIVFNQAAVEPAVTDLALKREPGSPAMMSYGTYDATIDALAGALAKGPYILGDQFSAADVVVGSGVRWMLMFKLLPERREFTSYAEKLSARPALQRAIAKDKELAAAQAA